MGRVWRTAAAIIAVFILGNCLRIWEGPRNFIAQTTLSPGRDSLISSINIRSGMYTSKGFLTGFQYTMLTAFADTAGVRMVFSGVYEKRDCWPMLLDSTIDAVAVDISDSIPHDYADGIVLSMPFHGFAWAVRESDHSLLYQMNMWLGYTVHTEWFREMEHRFFRSYGLKPYLESGTLADRISPYDEIIKAQSRMLGWDWRLLAAVVFKESRFSMGAYSRRGATGLMQVMGSTAAAYGITDLFNPEENIKAGAMHLRQIQERYRKMGLDSVNVVKFTLAAYNAGESRIEDCINFTLDQGRDFTDWNVVAATIPLMSEDEYLEDADYLKHGRFRGGETVKYVEDVLSKYDEYRDSVAE